MLGRDIEAVLASELWRLTACNPWRVFFEKRKTKYDGRNKNEETRKKIDGSSQDSDDCSTRTYRVIRVIAIVRSHADHYLQLGTTAGE